MVLSRTQINFRYSNLNLAFPLPFACVYRQLARLEAETVQWCREMVRNSPTALRILKSALNAAEDGHAGLQVCTMHVIVDLVDRVVLLVCEVCRGCVVV